MRNGDLRVSPLRRGTFGKRRVSDHPKNTQKVCALPYGRARPGSPGALTPALLWGHAVTGHPWPGTAGSASCLATPQQHLRSASCDGRLRCTDYRVAAEASALKAKSKKQKLAPAPNLDLERGRTPGGAAKCPGGVFQCAPTGITEVYRMPPRWFSPDAFRWHLLCIQHGASARPDPEPVIPSLASSSPLK